MPPLPGCIVTSKAQEVGAKLSKSLPDPPHKRKLAILSKLEVDPGLTQAPDEHTHYIQRQRTLEDCYFKLHTLTALLSLSMMREPHSQGTHILPLHLYKQVSSAACFPQPSNAIILSGQLVSPDQCTKALLALTTFFHHPKVTVDATDKESFADSLSSGDGGR